MQRSMHVSASAGRWICPDQGQDGLCERDWPRWDLIEGLVRDWRRMQRSMHVSTHATLHAYKCFSRTLDLP